MIFISEASIEDIDHIIPLFNDYRIFYKQESDILGARDFLKDRFERDESIIFLAFQEEKAIGFTQLYPSFSSVSMQKMYILNDLYVDVNYRNLGIATLLLNHAKNFALERNSKGLSLETHRTNPAQKLYEKLGWVEDKDYAHYMWTIRPS